MKRMITTLALAATMVLASASVALAAPNDSAACEGAETANHGGHITEHYVGGPDGNAGGGKPAHFGANDGDPTPGATFCQGDNSAPDLRGTPGRFA